MSAPGASAPAPLQRAVLAGAASIALFVLVALAVNPLVADETLGSGAVLAQMPPYPPGHPHLYFYQRAFCLGNYVTAWALQIGATGDGISAARNGAALFLGLFVPYAAALVLTRRWSFAIAAAVLAALEAPCAYDGLYPVLIYPDIYSHGQIGQSLAVLAAVAWLAGATRSAALLTGAMPMVHAGMVPVLWLWCALSLGFSRGRPRGAQLRRAFAWGALGLAACAAFYALTRATASGFEAVAPYAAPDGDPRAAIEFVALTDFHRQVPSFGLYGYAMHALALALLSFALLRGGRELGERENGPAAHVRWLLLFAGSAWAYTLGCALLQTFALLPYPLLMAMPARITNLSTLLLVPLSIAAWQRVLASLEGRERAALWSSAGAVAFAAGVWLFARGPWAVREHTFMFAWGLLLGAGLWSLRGARRELALCALAGLAVFALLLAVYPRPPRHVAFGGGAALALLACFASRTPLAWLAPLSSVRVGAFLALVGGLVAAAGNLPGSAVIGEAPGRWVDFGKRWRCDVLSRYDREMIAWMDANVPRSAPVATAAWVRLEVQQKTAHPVLVETETLWMLTYMPELGSSIGPLIADFFEVDFTKPDELRALAGGGRFALTNPHWPRVWRERSLERWQQLAQQYDFELVVSPEDTPLALPRVVDGNLWDLYRIPRG